MQNAKIGKAHVFTFNPEDNGGEALMLKTQFFDNGDGVLYTNQEITLQSYCNAASFELVGATITPDKLRQLANELERAQIKAQAEVEKACIQKCM